MRLTRFFISTFFERHFKKLQSTSTSMTVLWCFMLYKYLDLIFKIVLSLILKFYSANKMIVQYLEIIFKTILNITINTGLSFSSQRRNVPYLSNISAHFFLRSKRPAKHHSEIFDIEVESDLRHGIISNLNKHKYKIIDHIVLKTSNRKTNIENVACIVFRTRRWFSDLVQLSKTKLTQRCLRLFIKKKIFWESSSRGTVVPGTLFPPFS